MTTFILYFDQDEEVIESCEQLVRELDRLQDESRGLPRPELATIESSSGESMTFGFTGDLCVVGTSDANKIGHISSDSIHNTSKQTVTLMLEGEPTELYCRYFIAANVGKKAIIEFYSKGILHSKDVAWQPT